MKTHKILLVDDDADDQFFFLDAVQSISPDIECEVAGNGVEGLQKIQNSDTLPTVIFLDLNMPLMNGYEFLEKIKSVPEHQDIPVIIISTSNSEKDKSRTSELGAAMFMTKTANYREFRTQLADVLSQFLGITA